VMRGDVYLTPAVSRYAIDKEVGGQRSSGRLQSAPQTLQQGSAGQRSAGNSLTLRQCEIVQLIAQGRTTQEIARLLALSPKTVEAHRAQVMEKLGIYNIPGLVRYAIKTGLCSLDD
jgi:DNA-binding NarL/FixJ family response regulator